MTRIHTPYGPCTTPHWRSPLQRCFLSLHHVGHPYSKISISSNSRQCCTTGWPGQEYNASAHFDRSFSCWQWSCQTHISPLDFPLKVLLSPGCQYFRHAPSFTKTRTISTQMPAFSYQFHSCTCGSPGTAPGTPNVSQQTHSIDPSQQMPQTLNTCNRQVTFKDVSQKEKLLGSHGSWWLLDSDNLLTDQGELHFLQGTACVWVDNTGKMPPVTKTIDFDETLFLMSAC